MDSQFELQVYLPLIFSYLTEEWKVKRSTEKNFSSMPQSYPSVSSYNIYLLNMFNHTTIGTSGSSSNQHLRLWNICSTICRRFSKGKSTMFVIIGLKTIFQSVTSSRSLPQSQEEWASDEDLSQKRQNIRSLIETLSASEQDRDRV